MGKNKNITDTSATTEKEFSVNVCPSIKYKVPKGLGTLVAKDKEQRKAIDTFIVIKAHITAPRFANTPRNIQQIAIANRRHVKTIRARLEWLCANGLATLKNGNYSLLSWEDFCAHYGILKQFNFFKSDSYFFTKFKGYVENILESQAVMSRIEYQHYIFKIKTDFPEYKETCASILGTSDSEAILKHQRHIYGKGERFKTNEDWLLNEFRADFQISGNTLKQVFGLSGLGAAVYIKRKMQAKGLWTVTKREYECGNDIPREVRNTHLGSWHWDNKTGKIMLVMPDKIKANNINSIYGKN